MKKEQFDRALKKLSDLSYLSPILPRKGPWVDRALTRLLEVSPGFEGEIFNEKQIRGKKWAVHGKNCVWWTSFPEDCGQKGGRPCCPFCGGLVAMVPLEVFIEEAKNDPTHYGPDGLVALLGAHHRSARTCRTRFFRYQVKIKEQVEIKEQVDQLLSVSPGEKGELFEDGNKWVIHGKNCRWWSSSLEDGGQGGGHPCCPFCEGLVAMVPLADFIEEARQVSPSGLDSLMGARHRSARTCRTRWIRYQVEIRDENEKF